LGGRTKRQETGFRFLGTVATIRHRQHTELCVGAWGRLKKKRWKTFGEVSKLENQNRLESHSKRGGEKGPERANLKRAKITKINPSLVKKCGQGAGNGGAEWKETNALLHGRPTSSLEVTTKTRLLNVEETEKDTSPQAKGARGSHFWKGTVTRGHENAPIPPPLGFSERITTDLSHIGGRGGT